MRAGSRGFAIRFAYFLALLNLVAAEGVHAQISPYPPPGPVRTPAEFEPARSVVVNWNYAPGDIFNPVQVFMLRNIPPSGAKVYVIVKDFQQQRDIEIYLASQSPPVDMTHVEFLYLGQWGMNSWARDYMGQSIFFGDGTSPGHVDVDYNRAGSEEVNAFPQTFAGVVSLPLFSADQSPNRLRHQGGDFLTDGFGFGLSSESILAMNDYDADLIANVYNNYYGIFKNHIVTGVHFNFEHIDLLMKFLDEETLLVGQYPSPWGDGIDAAIQYITSNFLSAWGTPYKIIRIPTPSPDQAPTIPAPDQFYSYTNSLIVNNTVLVPLFGKPEDAGALAIYKSAMPGYKVIGYDFSPHIRTDPIGNFNRGFIHCLTHENARENSYLTSFIFLPYVLDVRDGAYQGFEYFISRSSLTLDGSIQVKPGAHVRTKSDGRIVLGPGFRAEPGSYFRASIKR